MSPCVKMSMRYQDRNTRARSYTLPVKCLTYQSELDTENVASYTDSGLKSVHNNEKHSIGNDCEKDSDNKSSSAKSGDGTTKLNSSKDNANTISTGPFDTSYCRPQNIPDSINSKSKPTEILNYIIMYAMTTLLIIPVKTKHKWLDSPGMGSKSTKIVRVQIVKSSL